MNYNCNYIYSSEFIFFSFKFHLAYCRFGLLHIMRVLAITPVKICKFLPVIHIPVFKSSKYTKDSSFNIVTGEINRLKMSMINFGLLHSLMCRKYGT